MNQTPFLRTGCILEIAVPAEALTPLLNGADHRACIPLNDGISGSTVRVTRSHHVAIAVLRIGIPIGFRSFVVRSEEHTSELQSRGHLVCRLLLEKKNSVESMRRAQ